MRFLEKSVGLSNRMRTTYSAIERQLPFKLTDYGQGIYRFLLALETMANSCNKSSNDGECYLSTRDPFLSFSS
jgi:hypothetical protein